MRESELLSHIYARSKGLLAPGARVLVGPGDDCAVITAGEGNTPLLFKVDQVVEGRHFLSSTPIDLIARKAVARAVSDIAAMGGSPTVGLCGAVLPANYTHADALFDAVARWAMRFGCPLVGGDISMLASDQAGPLVLGMTIVGTPHATRGPVLRSGALAGDSVYVTGALGNSFASGRHLTFEPRLKDAAWLCDSLGDRLHAMMDISDGLGRDAGRLALASSHASSVCIEIDADRIPRNADCATWDHAVREGEDYELLFTASGSVPSVCPATGVAMTRIGAVVSGTGAVVLSHGKRLDASEMGWEYGGDA
jgi:thiamine-monophosphate kinase